MGNYICKIATLEEIIKRMDYLIEIHPNNNLWIRAKENAIRGYKEKSKIMYIGLLNNEIICEATAYVNELAFIGDIKNTEKWEICRWSESKERAYLSAFRTNKEYENNGYFSKLYKYMEKDLKEKGYKELSLGVEPNEIRNILIYFKYGFTNYIKTTIESLPGSTNNSKPIEEIVNFYYKKI